MKFLVLLAVVALLALLVVMSPHIEEKRQECKDNGGIWLPKQLICIGDNK